MKINLLSSSRRGFTLVELLAVVAIIVILAGIVVGALLQVGKQQAKKQTKVTLNNCAMKLEEYFNDNQFYPEGDDVFSEVLYVALSGDESGRGEGEPLQDGIYWKELLQTGNNPLVGQRNGQRIILDGYSQSIRYRSATQDGEPSPLAKNADYDLWSVGPDGEPSGPNIDSKIENEQTIDDIWPQ